MGETLGTLLRAASDPVADVRPPAVAELVARRRRRTRLRTSGAVLATVATVVSVAAVVANRPDRSGGRHHVAPAISRPRPAVTPVTVGQLAGYRWRAVPTAPIPPRDGAAMVWTGRQLIVWGGASGSRNFSDGAAYTPATRSWTKLPPSPLHSGGYAAAVWTGAAVIIWGADGGAAYFPATGRWTALPRLAEPADGVRSLVTGDGRVIAFHGSVGKSAVRADAYDPTTGQWQGLPELKLPAGHGAAFVAGLEIGGTPYVWVEWSHNRKDGPNSVETTYGVDGFRLVAGQWRTTQVGPQHGFDAAEVALVAGQVFFPQTGSSCASCTGPPMSRYGGWQVDPRTGKGQGAPELGSVGGGDYVSTGGAVLVLNSSRLETGAHGTKPGDLAAWEPGRRSWQRLPSAPLGAGEQASVVWAGDRLFVWGSRGGLEFAG